MSITIDWANLTSGPSGLALADSIRDFIHEKFQQVTLPRFIRSVHVHTFDFGEECPVVELKDISDPLPEFYERDEDSSSSSEDGGGEVGEEEVIRVVGGTNEAAASTTAPKQQQQQRQRQQQLIQPHTNPPPAINTRLPNLHLRSSNLPFPPPTDQISTPFLSRSNATTPGMPIPGGTSNFSYFHLPLSNSSSGGAGLTPTPLMPWGEQQPAFSPTHFDKDPTTRPTTTRDATDSHHHQQKNPTRESQHPHPHSHPLPPNPPPTKKTPAPPPPPSTDRSQDLQTTLHISYHGTLSLSLTAEILLDYPMPSFVGIPLKLQITGLSFDGVALVAYLRQQNASASSGDGDGNKDSEVEGEGEGDSRRKIHFCFLGREDAIAMLGPRDSNREDRGGGPKKEEEDKEEEEQGPPGGLLRSIRVESEIGRQEDGKQVLKNVGKVEKFVLEQVRRIFEEEFVWPSFWTFLV